MIFGASSFLQQNFIAIIQNKNRKSTMAVPSMLVSKQFIHDANGIVLFIDQNNCVSINAPYSSVYLLRQQLRRFFGEISQNGIRAGAFEGEQ